MHSGKDKLPTTESPVDISTINLYSATNITGSVHCHAVTIDIPHNIEEYFVKKTNSN